MSEYITCTFAYRYDGETFVGTQHFHSISAYHKWRSHREKTLTGFEVIQASISDYQPEF